MIDLTVLCPSRNRPEAAGQLAQSFAETRTAASKLFFLVDTDDSDRKEYPTHLTLVAKRMGPIGSLNHWARSIKSRYVGFMGDDSRFATHGWDRQVIDALDEHGGGIAWCDDGHEKPWPSTVFMSVSIVKALGYMVPPAFQRAYFDVFWVHLADVANCSVILPDVSIPHNNIPGVVSRKTIDADRGAYLIWREQQANWDADATIAALSLGVIQQTLIAQGKADVWQTLRAFRPAAAALRAKS